LNDSSEPAKRVREDGSVHDESNNNEEARKPGQTIDSQSTDNIREQKRGQ
jgi:hypothetical protein